MNSEAKARLIKLFCETPQAQEIYATLRQRREAAVLRQNKRSSCRYIPETPEEKDDVSIKSEKDYSLDEDMKDVKVVFDEPFCSCEEQAMSETDPSMPLSEYVNTLSHAFQNVSNSTVFLQENQKKAEMMKWSIKIVKNGEIVVEGQRSGDAMGISWRTSVICDRISTNVVRSAKGTLYFLLGECNESDMIEKGFSKEFITMFRYGFPPNWRDILQNKDQHKREPPTLHNVSGKNTLANINDRKRISVEHDVLMAGHYMNNVVHDTDDVKIPEQQICNKQTPLETKIEKKSSGTKKIASTKKSEKISSRLTSDEAVGGQTKYPSSEHSMDELNILKQKSDKTTARKRQTSKSDYEKKNSASVKKEATKRRRRRSKKPVRARSDANVSDVEEIQVQRSRSGRLICPVLDFWRGQRIDTFSPGEMSIVKSHLEQNSTMTLVETNKNPSFIQSSTVSSSVVTSDTEMNFISSSSTSTTTTTVPSKTTSIPRNKKQIDDSSESGLTDVVDRKLSKKFNKKTRDSPIQTRSRRQSKRLMREKSESERSEAETGETSTRNALGKRTKALKTMILSQTDSQIESEPETSKRDVPKRFKSTSEKDVKTKNSTRKMTSIRSKPTSSLGKQVTDSPGDSDTSVDKFKKVRKMDIGTKSTSIPTSSYPKTTKICKDPKVKTGKLTSRMGTLAKKRELRCMLEQQDDGYEDDAFEGTPFCSQKVAKRHTVSPVDITEPADLSQEMDERYYKTPRSRTPMNHLRPAGPLSSEKSEHDMTPGLLNSVNRNNLDRYVNRLRRQKLFNVRKKAESHTPLKTNNKPNRSKPIHMNYSFDIQKSTRIEDDDADHYFSSEDE